MTEHVLVVACDVYVMWVELGQSLFLYVPVASYPGSINAVAENRTWYQTFVHGQILHTFRVNHNIQNTCSVYVAN